MKSLAHPDSSLRGCSFENTSHIVPGIEVARNIAQWLLGKQCQDHPIPKLRTEFLSVVLPGGSGGIAGKGDLECFAWVLSKAGIQKGTKE